MKTVLKIAILLSFLLSAQFASAAIFSTTADGTPKQFVGDTHVYHVQYTKNHTQIANAIGFELHFNPDIVQVDSISSENTLIDLWVQRPKYDNERGVVEMSGGGFNIDRDQRLLTIVFTAVGPGTAILDFQDIELFANDGLATPIAHRVVDGRIVVVEPPVSNDEEQIERSSSILLTIALILTLLFPFVIAYFFFFDKFVSSRREEDEL